MMLRITLWALLLGSIVMGFLGFKTGSATTTIVGMGVLIFVGFILFFLAKMLFELGIGAVKIFLIIVLILIVGLGVVKGYQLLFSKTRILVEKTDNEIQAGRAKVTAYLDEKKADYQKTHAIEHSSEVQTPPADTDVKPQDAQTAHPTTTPDKSSVTGETNLSWSDKFILWCDDTWAGFKGSIADWFKKKEVPTTQQIQLIQHPTLPQSTVATPQPEISGLVTDVKSGYLFKMGDRFIKLYGIDTPDMNQTCLNAHGQTFDCGKTAKLWLQRLIIGKVVTCKLVSGDNRGNYVAACQMGGQDIGAGMVGIGWAIADRHATDVYISYEQTARAQGQGLWAGKFVAPWQARHKNTRTH